MTADTARLTGCGTALVTPFNDDGTVDEDALRALVDWQIAEGIHFLVPCGSTGEAATMTIDEHCRVVEIVVKQANGRVPIVAGAASNDTQKAIDLSKRVADLGATHLLHTSPWYNKPPQRGIVAHYRGDRRGGRAADRRLQRSGAHGEQHRGENDPRAGADSGVVATKEASGQLSQIADVIRGRGPEFSVLSGDDELTLPVMALGGDGIVSVVSNATPRPMSELCNRMMAGDYAGARKIHMTLLPWMRAAFVESNPIPVKAALACMGKIKNVLRSPLVPLSEAHGARCAPHCPPPEPARVVTDLRALQEDIETLAATPEGTALPTRAGDAIESLLAALEAGTVRSASKGADDLARQRVGQTRDPARIPLRPLSRVAGSFVRGQGHVPVRRFGVEQNVRVVPGGSSCAAAPIWARRRVHAADLRQRRRVRRQQHDGRFARPGRIVRADRQARPRERAAQIGGVLEPVNAMPVVIEDDVFVGGNCGVYEGTIVRARRARRGLLLTRGTPVFDLAMRPSIAASATQPLKIPEGAVVVPGPRGERAVRAPSTASRSMRR